MEAASAIVRSPTLAQWGTSNDASVIVAAAAKMAASDRSMYCRRSASPPLACECSENSTICPRLVSLTGTKSATLGTPGVNARSGDQ